MTSEEYVEFPEMANLEFTDKLQVLPIMNGNIIQRVQFPEYLGEVELFHGTYSLGRTTAGFLTFPSPESARLTIDEKEPDTDITKQGVTPGLPVYRMPESLYAKIHLKYKYAGQLHTTKVPLILWKANILQAAGGWMRMKYNLH